MKTIKKLRKLRRSKKQTPNRTKNIYVNQIPSEYKNITAEISINSLQHNISYFRKITNTDIMPIIKADGYGHGLVDMSKILRNLNITYLGVATAGEAILLRNNGDNGRILCWLYDIKSPELKEVIKLDIDVAIFDESHIPIIEKLVPYGKKARITLHVDTGINRAGVPYDKAYNAAIDINKSDKFEFVGLMSHLISSQIRNSHIVNQQLTKFRELRSLLEDIDIKPPLQHIANTCAGLNYDVSDFTISRIGGGIYGLTVDKNLNKKLLPIMSVKSKLIQIKNINKGDGIGYDSKYIASKNRMIGCVPIGYADILPRNASLKVCVYVNGTKRRVLGLESMDQIVIETKKQDKINDDVFIFGNGKNCKQTIYDLANISNTITYDIVTHIGNRVNRIYV
jgi:alanine racemase